MSRRLHQTLADYVVIAISPALIMGLVGSLVFFLLTVFYQGTYPERLYWVMGCFVFAAVLIGRITIAEGFERAAPFGIALALLVGIAANRFMEYQGTWIDRFSWIINFGLIGVVWWCAHQLTWDCTVIDDDQDSSGEGLMQIAGLEQGIEAKATAEPEGTTSREVPAGFWQRYVQHQHRPHAPGLWVVYFSLAALPIFGLGQWLIPLANTSGRRAAFWLLAVYVACGLALLVTTSFLGLRRYLRQRRIEMPTLMANLWIGTGAAIIAALLVVAALLPRPSAEYAISQLPFALGSPDQSASRFAPPTDEGAKDQEPGPATDPQSQDEQTPTGDQTAPDGRKSDEPGDGKSQSDRGKQQQDSSGGDAKSSNDGQQEQQQGEPQSSDGQQSPDGAKKQEESADAEKQPSEPSSDNANSSSTPPTPQRNAWHPPDVPLAPVVSPLVQLLKWAFYAAFALAVLWAVWTYWQDIARAIAEFIRGLLAWWAGLWGSKRDYGLAADEPLAFREPPPAFASFADPFTTGLAARYSVEELVRYSFEAFEAWSREHGCERQPDQTLHEHVRDVAKLHATIAPDARSLAELYARAAYAKGQLPPNSTESLRRLWQQMTTTAGVRTFVADDPVWQ